MKEVTNNDEPTNNYHPNVQLPSAVCFSLLIQCFGFYSPQLCFVDSHCYHQPCLLPQQAEKM